MVINLQPLAASRYGLDRFKERKFVPEKAIPLTGRGVHMVVMRRGSHVW
jgi:hypothetical protein